MSMGKKKNEVSIRSSAAEYLTFVASTGDSDESIEMRYEDENIWLTQKMMAVLYDVDIRTINEHVKKIYADNELTEAATIRNFRIVQREGSRQVSRNTKHYNLQMIIAVGFKVNNERAVQFRKWANIIVKDYTIQGWVMDDERLKNGGTVLTKEYFEKQLKQIEINIDYILMLVAKYHSSHCEDKEVLVTIRKAVDASPELRSKKALIEHFIGSLNGVKDVIGEWQTYVTEERERELAQIISEEHLKEPETRKFVENAFRDGKVKTTGTDIGNLMPPISRIGGKREKKKQTVIDKLESFFERFFGIGGAFKAERVKETVHPLHEGENLSMAAENAAAQSADTR
ncbi:MAG: virulence RhuM family protein [Akkermansiaceae bacterium]|nr:virulence RhuM family protein [Akkermansiaceae bacterium]